MSTSQNGKLPSRFSLLTLGFNSLFDSNGRNSFEFVKIYMKAALVTLIIVPFCTENIKLIIMVWIFVGYSLLLSSKKPFWNGSLNRFDRKSGLVYVLTLFSLWFTLQNSQEFDEIHSNTPVNTAKNMYKLGPYYFFIISNPSLDSLL